MKDPREMNEEEIMKHLVNEYVHFHWVKKTNRQVALLAKEIKEKKECD